jgi:hypothetical protein
MRPILVLVLGGALMLRPAPAPAQEELSSVATLQLADGTSVALVQWKLTYEFASWKSKEPISTAKPQVRENPGLIFGKKTFPVKGDTLTFKHVEADDAVRVVSVNLRKAGELKVEQPARDVLAPDLDKDRIYQPRSLDLTGKTLSGIDRSFCLIPFSTLVECGGTRSTRVVKIDFN